MNRKSYVWWNVVGVAIAIVGFVIGSLKGTMGGGGAHTAIGASIGIAGVVMAVTAHVLERRRLRSRS
jgi:uncharacterized membrane protein YhaH (DUF805 family)